MKGIVPAIGGYKGIGMITASNILAGILSGSAHTGEVAVGHRGQFFLVMDLNIFREKDDYYDTSKTWSTKFQEKKMFPGQQVYLPGEIE